MSGNWRIVDSYFTPGDIVILTKTWVVEGPDGQIRTVKTNDYEDESAVGAAISRGEFSDPPPRPATRKIEQEEAAPSPRRQSSRRPSSGGGGGGFSGGGSSSGGGGGLAGLALIVGIFVIFFEDKPPPVPPPTHLPVGELIDQALADPNSLSSIPPNRMTAAEYGLAHSFVRYDSPRRMIAPGSPGLRWNVPIHAGPTTLTAKLGELSYFEEVTAHGHVKGADGRIWEVVTRSDGTKGFVVQRELRERDSVPNVESERATYSLDENEAKRRATALDTEVRNVERAIYRALPSDQRVDFGLERANWYTNNIMIGCGGDAYCKIKRYNKRLESLRELRSANLSTAAPTATADNYKAPPRPSSGASQGGEEYGDRSSLRSGPSRVSDAAPAEAPKVRPVEEACVWFNDRKVCPGGTEQ